MQPDVQSKFGVYQATKGFSWLIASAQSMPSNWLGRRLALLCRKLVLNFSSLPLDVCVESIKMRCYLRDNVSERKFVFMPWLFDAAERALMLRVLPRDGVFVDIGANVGIYTLIAAAHLNSRGRIIALEPNPPAYARLSFNIAATRGGRTDWPRIDAMQLGASDVAGEFILQHDISNLGGSSIAPRRQASAEQLENANQSTRIPCQPLQHILQANGVNHIDVLKIDVEGAKDLVLIPFLATASRAMLPRYMIVENSANLWQQDLLGTLAANGYTIDVHTRMNTVYRLA